MKRRASLLALFAGILMLVSALLSEEVRAQSQDSWTEVQRIDTFLNPTDFWIGPNGSLLVLDVSGREDGLLRYDLGEKRITARTGVGSGPGEVAPYGHKTIHRFSDGRWWLFDLGHRRATVYDATLQPIETSVLQALDAGLAGDSKVVRIPSGTKTFAHVHRLTSEGEVESSPVWSIRTAGDFLEPLLDNPLLKQGFAAHDGSDTYVAFTRSSLVIHFEEGRIAGETLGPEDIPFPPSPHGAQMPAVEEHPPTTLDLALDKRYLYVLHSGKTPTLAMTNRYAREGRLHELGDYLSRSARVLVYDRSTLGFVRELTLPVEAKKIEADSDGLYLLADTETGPAIIQYAPVSIAPTP